MGTALTACASSGAPAPTASNSQTGPSREQILSDLKSRPIPDDPLERATYWAQRAEIEPGDATVSVQFAKSLRGIGSNRRAVEFLEERLMIQPGQPDLLAEYGKSLVADGRPGDAIPVLAQAAQLKPSDWTILVAQGVAYDQLMDYGRARQSYQAALAISPNNPSILNNMGLSYLAEGDTASAAKYLRMAAAAPGADDRVRANLAMVASAPVPAAAPQKAASPTPVPPAAEAKAPDATPIKKPAADRVMKTPSEVKKNQAKTVEPPEPAKTAAAEPAPATGAPRAMVTDTGAAELRRGGGLTD
jgi:Flp pilus assembly protein TadD